MYVKYIRDQTPCGHENAKDAECFMSNGFNGHSNVHWKCDVSNGSNGHVEMSSGHLTGQIYPYDTAA